MVIVISNLQLYFLYRYIFSFHSAFYVLFNSNLTSTLHYFRFGAILTSRETKLN